MNVEANAIPRRQKKLHDLRHQLVLDATRNLLTIKAIDDISMANIATESEYSRRTLYAYFRGRDDILFAVFVEDLIVRCSDQERAIEGKEKGLDKLIVWARTLEKHTEDTRFSGPLQAYWDFNGIDPGRISDNLFVRFMRVNDRLAGQLRSIFERGTRDGSIRADLDVDVTISLFLYSFRAVLHRAQSNAYTFADLDSKNYTATYLDLFSRAIGT